MAKKIALAHDFLLKLGGAERVLKSFADLFPTAPIFCLLYDEKSVGKVFPKERIITSKLQNLPQFIRNKNKLLLPFLPTATENLDFSDYDIVLSSSNSYMHGIITSSKTTHYCYCHSPMRYIWDWKNEYLQENNLKGLKKFTANLLLKKIRIWDQAAADRVDHYISNSKNVQKRIKKYYRQDSKIIYPPVATERFIPGKKHQDYFLIVSTLSPYKRIDLAVKVFNKIGRKLIIIGEGSHKTDLQRMSNSNIEFLGFKSDEVVAEYMQNCRALIFPGEDDFGITPVEAMACGKPVLAYGKGGALETVIPGETGEFFYQESEYSFEQGLAKLLLNESLYDYEEIAKHAQKFNSERFIKEIKSMLE